MKLEIKSTEWKKILAPEMEKEYFKNIQNFLSTETSEGKTIFPQSGKIFSSLDLVDFSKVKVLILGQDPYHGDNQANGFAFAVNQGQKIPPSLKNIFKELVSEYPEFKEPDSSLLGWAAQGVLMINAILTVEKSSPASHKEVGWEQFTNEIIKKLNERKEPLVFILWGNFAQKKEELINNPNHLILKSVHPSPFSARNGFFGNNHFLKVNEFLKSKGLVEIDWTKTKP